MKAARVVEYFNSKCAIGTPVTYWPSIIDGPGTESRTASRAWLLGGHTPVVLVEGYPGGIALTHVLPKAEGVLSKTIT
jgi:hypothetical protein